MGRQRPQLGDPDYSLSDLIAEAKQDGMAWLLVGFTAVSGGYLLAMLTGIFPREIYLPIHLTGTSAIVAAVVVFTFWAVATSCVWWLRRLGRRG